MRYWFFDKDTGENIYIEAGSLAEAMIISLHMVLEAKASHPIYICKC